MGDNKILSQNKIKIFDLFKINYFNILFFIYNKMFRKNFKTNYFIFINFMYFYLYKILKIFLNIF